MKMPETADLLINSLNPTNPDLYKERLSQLTQTEWDDLVTLASQHKVESLLYRSIKQHGLVEQLPASARWLHRKYRENTVRNLQIYAELGQLLEKLEEHNIPLVLLKGVYLARAVYQMPTLRYMADYDVLVHKADLPAVVEIVTELGYQPLEPIRLENKTLLPHLPPFRKEKGVADLEIHWTIVRPTHPKNIDIDELWQRVQPFSSGGIEALSFCPEDLLLHLCFHAAYDHFFMQGLRPLCDIARLVENSGIDWQVVHERSIAWNCSRGTYLMLYLAHNLLGADIPLHVLEIFKPQKMPTEMIDTAKTFLFVDEEEADDSISENFMRITGERPLHEKTELLLQRFLISPQELAHVYKVSADSPLVYLYYPRRIWDFLSNAGQQGWNYLSGSETFKEETGQRNRLVNWMEQN